MLDFLLSKFWILLAEFDEVVAFRTWSRYAFVEIFRSKVALEVVSTHWFMKNFQDRKTISVNVSGSEYSRSESNEKTWILDFNMALSVINICINKSPDQN